MGWIDKLESRMNTNFSNVSGTGFTTKTQRTRKETADVYPLSYYYPPKACFLGTFYSATLYTPQTK